MPFFVATRKIISVAAIRADPVSSCYFIYIDFLRILHWFLHIQASQKPQTSGLLCIRVSADVEQIWLRHPQIFS
jgi:hypothetical protein